MRHSAVLRVAVLSGPQNSYQVSEIILHEIFHFKFTVLTNPPQYIDLKWKHFDMYSETRPFKTSDIDQDQLRCNNIWIQPYVTTSNAVYNSGTCLLTFLHSSGELQDLGPFLNKFTSPNASSIGKKVHRCLICIKIVATYCLALRANTIHLQNFGHSQQS